MQGFLFLFWYSCIILCFLPTDGHWVYKICIRICLSFLFLTENRPSFMCSPFILHSLPVSKMSYLASAIFITWSLLHLKYRSTHPAVLHHDALWRVCNYLPSHTYTHKCRSKYHNNTQLRTHTETKHSLVLSLSLYYTHTQAHTHVHLWNFVIHT